MRIITIILPLLLLAGCEGRYRYPCQDPANWGKIECNNEVCKSEGTCTSDVTAPAGTRGMGLDTQSKEVEEVSTGDEETEISSSGCSQPQASYEADDNKRDFKVKHKIVDKDVVVMDPEGDEYIEPRTPPGMEEPVTMKSEVDAIEHDKAVE
jgi:uncharacterized lipoprotein NlpE involved in copper resistance